MSGLYDERYLFRGKRIDTGEWVQGDLLRDKNGNPSHIRFWGKLGIDCAEIDPATRGQCTGLHDKNGTRIFEGDIVTSGEHKPTVAVVESGFGRFQLRHRNGTFEFFHHKVEQNHMKIIGNIHDNPDLLNGGDGE